MNIPFILNIGKIPLLQELCIIKSLFIEIFMNTADKVSIHLKWGIIELSSQ